MKERIQKVLANYGVDSRRNIEQMVAQGRVAVNGKVMTKLPILIDPAKDKVTVDDELVRLASAAGRRGGAAPVEKLYFLLNKPKRVYSTNVAQGEQRLAKDLLPPDLPGRVYPVGRLDADSKGLLLLTNDGELTNLLTHPRYEVSKTYRAEVDGVVTDDTVKALQAGIWMADKDGKGFKTGRCRIKTVFRGKGGTVLEITIKEGRNRQVRRMLAKFGHKVRDLVRLSMGPLTLQGVGPGKFRPLTQREVKALYATAKAGGERSAARTEGPGAAAAKKAAAAKATAAKKAAGPKRPPVRQADAGKDLAVEFEDDDLRQEIEAEQTGGGGRGGKAAGGKKAGKRSAAGTGVAAGLAAGFAASALAGGGSDDEADGGGAGVEFVDLSPEEQAEMEAEAQAMAAEDAADGRTAKPITALDAEPDDFGDDDEGAGEDESEEDDELPE